MARLGYFVAITAFSTLSVHAQGVPHIAGSDRLVLAERSYDVIVAGGGAGGAAAALQARRMGASVALLAETSAIGGQLLTVPTMDEGWMFRYFPSGIYGELIGRLNSVYATKNLSTTGCYWDSGSRCYEPHIVRQELNALLQAAGIDFYLQATVTDVIMSGNQVLGVVFNDATSTGRVLGSSVLIDATEYGDVIPLTGAATFVGNGTGTSPGQCTQNITYAVPIKYYTSMPASLRLPGPPPNYDAYKSEFQLTVSAAAVGGGYPLTFLSSLLYRSMPDFARGYGSAGAPAKSSLNLANDYLDYGTFVKARVPPQYMSLRLDARFLTDSYTRGQGICGAKIKTLAFLYYMQDPQGLNQPNWSVADDEWLDTWTPADSCPGIPAQFKGIEALMPPIPYVRESTRAQTIWNLTARDIRRTPGADGLGRGPLHPSGVALADYICDFHNCNTQDTLEAWSGDTVADLSMPSGPFQVPLEAMIPVVVDGLIAAEKNFGSRVAASALRLQPSVISTGQAAGAIAALAARNGIQPRAVSSLQTQIALANAGARISMYADDDVPPGSPYWTDAQVAGARGIMIGTSMSHFDVARGISRREAATSISRAFGYTPVGAALPVFSKATFVDVPVGDWGQPYVEELAAHGVSVGCSTTPRRFCPDDPMTREQFAVSLVRAANLYQLAPQFLFTDVSPASAAGVEAAWRAGLIAPCGTQRFCPGDAALRGEVARGLVRALAYLGQ